MKQTLTLITLAGPLLFAAGCAQTQSSKNKQDFGTAPSVELVDYSEDPKYGYTELNSIKVGGLVETLSHRNQYLFLEQLAGPNGEEVRYGRIGSCCPQESSSSPMGFGMLDMWMIYIDGQEEPLVLFLDSYNYVQPMVPVGLTRRKN